MKQWRVQKIGLKEPFHIVDGASAKSAVLRVARDLGKKGMWTAQEMPINPVYTIITTNEFGKIRIQQ